MLKKALLLLVLAIISTIALSGCTAEESTGTGSVSQPEPTPTITQATPPTPTPMPTPKPETTISKYVYYYNAVATSLIYDLLSTSAKQKYTKDDVHNFVYAFTSNGVHIYDYNVVNKDVHESKAQLDVEITWNVMGYHKTHKYNISLTLEGGEWRLDDLILYKN